MQQLLLIVARDAHQRRAGGAQISKTCRDQVVAGKNHARHSCPVIRIIAIVCFHWLVAAGVCRCTPSHHKLDARLSIVDLRATSSSIVAAYLAMTVIDFMAM